MGESRLRPDGRAKVRGRFAFSSDLETASMLWGATLRSPHPHARIRSLDATAALAMEGVAGVVTAGDVPGAATYGLITADQPVFARDVVRFAGEPVAAVAADHPEVARRALEAVAVDYEPLPALVDPHVAPGAPPVHPDGNVIRRARVRHGDPHAVGDIVVEGSYEVGMQDQAFLGPESGLAVPDGTGGVDLWVATQWLHSDRDQLAACLGLPATGVRLHLAGVGGAFGAREDLSVHVHACVLALRTGRPVKMSYLRDESFVGHVHRHPATMHYRHHATYDGRLVKVEARVMLDGGAYASSSAAVVANAARFACGPYRVPNAVVDAMAVRTNNPPCGAMRGFGVVQVAFGHESQMDRLARRLGIAPAELRLRNVLGTGDVLPTGQRVTGAAPVAECLRAALAHPLPGPPNGPADGRAGGPAGEQSDRGAGKPTNGWAEVDGGGPAGGQADGPAVVDLLGLPGGTGRAAGPHRVRRGVGVALGFKNLMYSEGFADDSQARVYLEGGVARVTCAAAEVGQGFVTLVEQIARSTLGVGMVVLEPADTTSIGSAGSSSASRQTWMSGGAVHRACTLVAEQVRARLARELGLPPEALRLAENGRITGPGSPDGGIVGPDGTKGPDGVTTTPDGPNGRIVGPDGVTAIPDGSLAPVDVTVAAAAGRAAFEATATHRHRLTEPLDEDGQGDADVTFAFAAHRAVVDVDIDLGLVRVVQMATGQDVGRVLNPMQVVGQIEGGTAQGVGLAVMEEVVVRDGTILNPSFTDYLIPTAADAPEVLVTCIEEPEPGAPFGAKGVGEPPAISSTPAVVAAIRAATGVDVTRVPVHPWDLV